MFCLSLCSRFLFVFVSTLDHNICLYDYCTDEDCYCGRLAEHAEIAEVQACSHVPRKTLWQRDAAKAISKDTVSFLLFATCKDDLFACRLYLYRITSIVINEPQASSVVTPKPMMMLLCMVVPDVVWASAPNARNSTTSTIWIDRTSMQGDFFKHCASHMEL